MTGTDTARLLLDSAQAMVQERGFNAFSYKDLAAEVGIRTASIHYHFPSKLDLARALMERYLEGLEGALAEIDHAGRTNLSRLKRFLGLYRATEEQGVICACGSLASDIESLSEDTQDLVTEYFSRSEAWVAGILRAGQAGGEFTLPGRPSDIAASLVAALQGALLLSRARGRATTIDSVQRSLLASLQTT